MHRVAASDHMNHYLLAMFHIVRNNMNTYIKNCISYFSVFTTYMHVRVVDNLLTNRHELLLISVFLYRCLLYSEFLSAERTAFCVVFSP